MEVSDTRPGIHITADIEYLNAEGEFLLFPLQKSPKSS